ncbi:hypothetical protein OX283_000890 [Flavobacterium sp. SUN052]|uniref:hypothetical protein n=1 Tax=Flavobacterium sp. SUN052 TaxID=3002441 RepID=UPI00237DBB89|nr:hypothetical protein [Flavobacterium sp. SUN052]MEC4003197.1 hypothetical protein [Flavobacterium sp. SUN052]
MKKISIVIILLLIVSCNDWDNRLVLLNYSNKKINFYYELMDDNIIIPNLKNCDKTFLPFIKSNDKDFLRTQNKWDLYLKDHPNKILRVFIIDTDTLSKYGVCRIFKEHNFIKRLDFSYEELVKQNWKIEYK